MENKPNNEIIVLAKKISNIVFADDIIKLFKDDVLFFCAETSKKCTDAIYFSTKKETSKVPDLVFSLNQEDDSDEKNYEIVLGGLVKGEEFTDTFEKACDLAAEAKRIGVDLELCMEQSEALDFYKANKKVIKEMEDVNFEYLLPSIPDFFQSTFVIKGKYKKIFVREIYRFAFEDIVDENGEYKIPPGTDFDTTEDLLSYWENWNTNKIIYEEYKSGLLNLFDQDDNYTNNE